MLPPNNDESSLRLPNGFGFGGHIPTTLNGPTSATPASLASLGLTDAERWMALALIESMQGVGHTIPNPAVGCILTKDNGIIAKGATEQFGGRHAERVAFDSLQKTQKKPSDMDAYVTLEPCSHQGKQPPCCDLFRESGVQNLHIAVSDPNPLVEGRGLAFVQNYVPNVHVGALRRATTAWHLPFLMQHLFGRPLIVAKWAQTLDGALADESGCSQWITGPTARAHGHWLRLKYDVTAIGLTTLLNDQPSLTVRDCWRPNERQPHVCVMDALGQARVEDERLVTGLKKLVDATTQRKVALVTTPGNALHLKSRLGADVDLLSLPVRNTQGHLQDTAHAVATFWESTELKGWLGRPPQSIFIEGGAQFISSLLAIDAIDMMHVFIAPMILGGAARRLQHSDAQAPALKTAAHFDVLSTFPLGNDMLLELMPRRMVEVFFKEG